MSEHEDEAHHNSPDDAGENMEANANPSWSCL